MKNDFFKELSVLHFPNLKGKRDLKSITWLYDACNTV